MLEVEIERVLVVPTSVFHGIGHFQGFCGDVDRYLSGLLDPENLSYRPRNEVEEDPSYKQLIPYAVFRHTDLNGTERVFTYRRGKGQGEQRLHSKRSIGVGGHISSDDAAQVDGNGAYDEGLRRELDEEVVIGTGYRQQCVGLINDDETEVGRVHLGVVHLFDLEDPDVRPREQDLIDCGFFRAAELNSDLASFETWSQICIRELFA